MENPLADLVDDSENTINRKLSFEEQCAFYIALKLGVKPPAVEIATGLSRAAISQLNRAGQYLGGQIRYPKVVREYEKLGHEKFIHTYLTPPIRDRLAVAVDKYLRRERNPDLNAKGFNPLANRYCGRHEWRETSIGLHAVFQIELHPLGCGYFWRNLKPFQGLPEIPPDQISYDPAAALNGDTERGPERGPAAKGFPTSKACFLHVKRLFDPTAKQREETYL
jgi:hypothetical protein